MSDELEVAEPAVAAPPSLPVRAPIRIGPAIARERRAKLQAALIVSAALLSMLVKLLGVVAAVLPVAGLWAAILVVSLIRGRLRQRRPAEVVVDHDQVELPLGGRRMTFPSDELVDASLQRHGGQEVLFLSTAEGRFALAADVFLDRDDPARVAAALAEVIADLPAEQRVANEQRRHTVTALFTRPTPATTAVALALALAYAIEHLTGAIRVPLGLGFVPLGSSVSALVADGEWFRLLTAGLLHFNALHIVLNGMALLSLGRLIEKLVGPWRLTLIYLVGGVIGVSASALSGRAIGSLGASGAVFALLGALAVLQLRHQVPALARQQRRWWLVILTINALLPVLVRLIDWVAHLGGFLGGAAMTLAVAPTAAALDPHRPTPYLVRALAAVVVALHLVAVGFAAAAAAEPQLPKYRAMYADLDRHPELLNQLAWFLVESPDTPPTLLRFARDKAEIAHRLAPAARHITDTLAQSYHRLGNHDEAVDLELALVGGDGDLDPFFATQLGRFLAARAATDGVRTYGGVDRDAVHLAAHGDGSPRAISLAVDVGPRRYARVIAAVGTPDRLVGLLDACAGRDGRLVFLPADFEPTVELLLVDGRGCDRSRPARIYPVDPEAAALP